MDIKPIRIKADYQAALKEIEALMNARADTPQGERLDVLVTLVEAYEAKRYAMELPSPMKIVKRKKIRKAFASIKRGLQQAIRQQKRTRSAARRLRKSDAR